MKRIIKFRGYSTDLNKWVYGSLISILDPTKEADVPIWYYIHEGVNIKDAVLVTPESVGQFIGLHDKNGVEIYEGDILRGFRPQSEHLIEKEWKGVVKWASVRCAFVLECGIENPKYADIVSCDKDDTVNADTGIDYRYEIIGNIHQNKELLPC